MDPRSPSFEANLLYPTARLPDLTAAVNELATVIEAEDEILLSTEIIDGIFVLATCNAVQILLAPCKVPLPIEHFFFGRWSSGRCRYGRSGSAGAVIRGGRECDGARRGS